MAAEPIPTVQRCDKPLQSWHDFWAKAQTGDILLVSGAKDLDSPMAKSIKLATRSCFSHIGILIREPNEAMWSAYGRLRGKAAVELGTGEWGAGEEVPRDRQLYLFDSDYEEDGTVDGPVLRPVEEVLRSYLLDDYHGTDGDMVVRHLEVDDARRVEVQDKLTEFALAVAGRCFEAKSMTDGAFTQMLLSVWSGNSTEDLTRLFCSELTSAAYRSAGLLDAGIATNYQPQHFAEAKMTYLKEGARLGPETVIDLDALVNQVSVTIVSADGLRNPSSNPFGSTDPYCICSTIGDEEGEKGRIKFQTRPISKSLSPVWNHEQTILYDGSSSLQFELWDNNTFKDKIIGRGTLKRSEFIDLGYSGPIAIKQEKGDGGTLTVEVRIIQASISELKVGCPASFPELRCADGCRWVTLEHGQPLPSDAVQAGTTDTDGPVWVGRFGGEPGKINANGDNMCNFWGHSSKKQTKADILRISGPHEWLSIRRGETVPSNAVLAGETAYDGPTYVGRYHGEAGKINVEGRNMHNFWGHSSGRQEAAEILVRKSSCAWVGIEHGQKIADDAVLAGSTTSDGPVWVGRFGEEPGKINANDGHMHKFWGHSSKDHQNAEILRISGSYAWLSISRGHLIPANAVKAGETASDGAAYVARYCGEAGKMNTKEGRMFNFWGHSSGQHTHGEILVTA